LPKVDNSLRPARPLALRSIWSGTLANLAWKLPAGGLAFACNLQGDRTQAWDCAQQALALSSELDETAIVAAVYGNWL